MFDYNEYIYEVYVHKSFSNAAKSLFVSQPSLSNIVKKVEDDLGVVLFDRKSNPIQLTEAGKIYIDAIEKVMELEKITSENLKKLTDSKQNIFTLCGSTYFCTQVFPEIIEKYSDIDPELKIAIIEIGTGEIDDFLKFNLADLGVCVENLNPKLFNSKVWFNEELILAVPKSNSINDDLLEFALSYEDITNLDNVSQEKCVDLKLFQNENFIFLKEGNDLHDRAMNICYEYGFRPNILIYMDQLQTSYDIAKSGKGIVFIRDRIVKQDKFNDSLLYYKLKSDNAKRSVNLFYLKNKVFSDKEKEFIKYLKSFQL
ncbi:LysR family transcriptional regulator [Peptoniphilus sp. AGMB00490]|uniref:LysR family transcriptional regulator n=1 Tax=Peptoniphilus faecalis TaxID=2731255 RepID=A0A848RK95_9FIRM|nr:LysR family transcriptional regulator [Peptoniphilus faecalis]NMW84534.1 LysR family transcriptional regulator [Peptoniphilus faecalis]